MPGERFIVFDDKVEQRLIGERVGHRAQRVDCGDRGEVVTAPQYVHE
jgi:hypothetical protein